MPNIMLVDVDSSFLRGLKRALQEDGFSKVDGFSSAVKALKRAEKKSYDIIISDYRLADIDSMVFLKQLRQLQPYAVRIMKSYVTRGSDFGKGAVLASRNRLASYASLSRMVQENRPRRAA